MAKLAQTSIRFRDYEIVRSQFGQLSDDIEVAAGNVAVLIYGPDVQVDVVVEAGSLLVRITLIGSILWGTYDAVSKYPDFKKGIGELVKDAQEYGSAVVEEVMKATGHRKKPDSVNVREMTPGRISRVIEKLEEVKRIEAQTPRRVVRDELQKIARDVQAIERDLDTKELQQIDRVLESRGLPPLDKLPKPDEDRSVIRERPDAFSAPPKRREKLRHHRRFVAGEVTAKLPRPRR